MKAGFLTLGCRVNQYETEAIIEQLAKLGFEQADFNDRCDVYIINTCAVTEESVRKSRQMVRRAIKKNPDAFIGVTGCASQLAGSDFGAIPGVSFICGTRNKGEVCRAVEMYLKSGKMPRGMFSVHSPEGALERTMVTRFDRTRAYVKIQDGCRGRCSYCVIPSVRGDIVIRAEEEILDEVAALASNGCHEVVLTGIETAAYGNGLAGLIKKIDQIEGIRRIRMGSLEPSFMKASFVDAIADIPSLAHHFHLSVQNGSDRVLMRMRRKYNTQILEQNIAYIRKRLPDVNFSADVIVGFPGETEEDFLETCAFVRRNVFLHLHIFTYSKRPGTEAAEMENQLPESVKNERLHRLEAIAAEEKQKLLESVIRSGTLLEILTETVNRGMLVGHTGNFIECGIPLEPEETSEALRGQFLTVLPRKIKDGILICERIKE